MAVAGDMRKVMNPSTKQWEEALLNPLQSFARFGARVLILFPRDSDAVVYFTLQNGSNKNHSH